MSNFKAHGDYLILYNLQVVNCTCIQALLYICKQKNKKKKEYILVLNDFVMLQNKIHLSTNFILSIIL